MPYLVMDTGFSMAPYNHFELGQPFAIEYVWWDARSANTASIRDCSEIVVPQYIPLLTPCL